MSDTTTLTIYELAAFLDKVNEDFEFKIDYDGKPLVIRDISVNCEKLTLHVSKESES